MSRVIDSFKDSLLLLRENFLIIIIVFAVSILGIPISFFEILSSSGLTSLVRKLLPIVLVLIMPFVDGGIYGMLKESLNGKKSNLEIFKREGKDHYFRLLVGILIYSSVLGIVSFSGRFSKNPFYSLFGLLMLFIVVYLFQFFRLGIVIDGYTSLQSFKESFRFVWARKMSVFGFTILAGLIRILYLFLFNKVHIVLWFLPKIEKRIGIFTISMTYIIAILIFWAIVIAIIYSYGATYYIQTKEDDSISN